MATGGATASTSADGAAAEEVISPWPWLYTPQEWDPPQVKEAYEELKTEEDKLDELNMVDKYGVRVEKFLHTKTGTYEEFPADTSAGENIEISYKPSELKLTLPEFIAKIAPRRKLVLEGDDPLGAKINPICAEEIRYACIAKDQPLLGYTVVMLSIWIKYKPGYKSKGEIDEETMNVRYNVITFPHNEEWIISNLYFALKDPRDALMFINAVSKLVYTATEYVDAEIDIFERRVPPPANPPANPPTELPKDLVKKHPYFRMRWEKIGVKVRKPELKDREKRVSRMRPSLFGFVEVTKCTVQQRDKIDMERIEAEPDSDSDDDDEMTRTRLETDDEEEEGPPEKTETEKTLTPQVLYIIVDEEMVGFYEGPFAEQPLYDLRLFQNQTPQSIDMIYLCKKTGQLEIQQEGHVYIIKPTEKEPECFKMLDKLVKNRRVKAKPKKIFTDVESFLDYYDAMEMKLTNPEQIKDLQRKLLEKLDAQNKTFAESLGMSKKSKLPPGFPVKKEGEPRPPTPPPPSSYWIRFVLNRAHMKEMPDLNMAELWSEHILLEITRLLASNIEPATLKCNDSNSGDEDLRTVIGEIRQHLRNHENIDCKQAIAKLKAIREMFGADLLASLKDVDDIEVLERIFFLPG